MRLSSLRPLNGPRLIATSALVLAGVGWLAGCSPSESAPAAPDPDAVLSSLAPGILLASEDFGGWTLAERMEHAEAPAVAVTFVDKDGPVWTRAAGVLRADGSADIGPDTRFLAKSFAKPVTAFATALTWSGDFGAFQAERVE